VEVNEEAFVLKFLGVLLIEVDRMLVLDLTEVGLGVLDFTADLIEEVGLTVLLFSKAWR